jgi:hypothetical protein
MPESDALSGLQRAGYKVLGKPTDPTRNVVSDRTTYSVAFKNGRLVFADRGWPSSTSGELGAVLSALAALASYGASSCAILHEPLSNPNWSVDRVFIDCGERSVLLMKGKVDGAGNAIIVGIEERIGKPQ